MARLSRLGFLGIAAIFHLIYISSIFDIYFVSPVIHGMTAHRVHHEPPAKRVVLIVGDGLRADKTFQSLPDPGIPNSPFSDPSLPAHIPRPLAPFLRSIVLDRGTFGISHTRVPTESRPGHVALIAGLYEDVSSVTTGWTHNPVGFDSVFNRSKHTWSWGSPDILPMFADGAVKGRVTANTYDAHEEDFTRLSTWLDEWVFDRVKKFFETAKTDKELGKRVKEQGNVFFLHLLGLDTAGHAKRPHSKEYHYNIQYVDRGVQEITEMMEEFFGDDKTAFVFTADHGMGDSGAHGDGHPNNTRTPLIAWGSGIARPNKIARGLAKGHEDGVSSDWGLDTIQRNDVAQADVATLMAYLAGLELPVNSVGELPLDYLDTDERGKADAMLTNARGILEQYRVKEQKKQAEKIRYVSYKGFADEERSIDHRLAQIQSAIDNGEYIVAIQDSDSLIKLGLAGLRYLQTYDWLFLRTLVTAGYLGWIAFSFTVAIDQHVLNSSVHAERSYTSIVISSSMLIGLVATLFVESSPWTYYAYALFPILFWEEVYARRAALQKGIPLLINKTYNGNIAALGWNIVMVVGVMELMVQSYYHREIYTLLYIAAIFWPLSYGVPFLRENMTITLTWIICCISMSIFTLLPAIKTEDVDLLSIGGLLMFALALLYIIFERQLLTTVRPEPGLGTRSPDSISRAIMGVQAGLIPLAIMVTRKSVSFIQGKKELPAELQANASRLPSGPQIMGWVVLVSSLILPFLHGLQPMNHYLHRLVVIFLTFAPMFIILTISYEGLFYFAFSCTLTTWARLEHRIHHVSLVSDRKVSEKQSLKKNVPATADSNSDIKRESFADAFRVLTLADIRIALFFLYLLQSAFFSNGNIASISEFSLDAVYRLIPKFDPFSQGALLVLKILAPFVLVSANLGILTKRIKLRNGALFALVTGIGDWLTLRFFWAVKDEGSWLEIGTSITVFVIASMICVFVAGLEMVSEVLVGGIDFR